MRVLAVKSCGRHARNLSIRQCFELYVAQQRYRSQSPSGVTSTAGRSNDSASMSSLSMTHNVSEMNTIVNWRASYISPVASPFSTGCLSR
jgi:hypothetical protein